MNTARVSVLVRSCSACTLCVVCSWLLDTGDFLMGLLLVMVLVVVCFFLFCFMLGNGDE